MAAGGRLRKREGMRRRGVQASKERGRSEEGKEKDKTERIDIEDGASEVKETGETRMEETTGKKDEDNEGPLVKVIYIRRQNQGTKGGPRQGAHDCNR